jgi:hypothetical protein
LPGNPSPRALHLPENRQVPPGRQHRANRAAPIARKSVPNRWHAACCVERMAPQASHLVHFGIPFVCLVAVALVGAVVWLAGNRGVFWRFLLGAAVWLAFTALLGKSGLLAVWDARPPRPLLLLLPTLGLPLWLGGSRVGAALSRAPLWLLVGLHAFRLPLELLMHRAAEEGVMPPQMTYTGVNFDVVTGVTALVVATLVAIGRAPRWLVVGWNALGTLLLFVVVGVAVSSLPLFAAFGRDPSHLNTWVLYFPFVWLPAGAVSVAVLGHLLLWRRLSVRGMRGRELAALS